MMKEQTKRIIALVISGLLILGCIVPIAFF